MKQFFHRFILLGISGVLLIGCKAAPPSTKRPSPPVKPSALTLISAASTSEVTETETNDSDEEENSSSDTHSTGSPESLAHYAAGISYGLSDKGDLALEQFYLSASSDPTNEPLVLEISKTLLAKKQTQKAVDLLNKSAQRPDASASIFIWLAQSTFRLGKTNEALDISQTAIKKDSNSIDGYESLFDLYAKMGRTNDARRVLDRASKKVSTTTDLITCGEMHGVYLRTFGQDPRVKAQGMKILDRAAALKPFPEALFIPLAQAYEHIGEPLKQADIYQKLLVADSTTPAQRNALRAKLADIYLEAQDKKRGTELLKAIVRENPTHSQAWFMLGQLAVDENQLADAEADFQKVVLLGAPIDQAYYELALVQIDLHKTTEALKTLDQAREKFPRTFVGEFFTGLAYGRLKNFDEAIKHFTSAEAIAKASDPKRLNQQFYFQFGAACERNHQYKEAVEYFEKSLQIAPDNHEAMNYLGYMWAERGENLSKARELIEKALKSEPKNAAYLDSMGWVLFKLNKPDEALPLLLKAQELSPEPDATLFDHLGDVYNAVHQVEKARQAWQKSLELESNDAVKQKLEKLPVSSQ